MEEREIPAGATAVFVRDGKLYTYWRRGDGEEWEEREVNEVFARQGVSTARGIPVILHVIDEDIEIRERTGEARKVPFRGDYIVPMDEE